jgi:hypothetical protein
LSLQSRDSSSGLGIAQRAWKNLKYLEDAYSKGEDVHVSTARVLALVGLVGFPYEKGTTKQFKNISLASLIKKGWPQWAIKPDEPQATTLHDLLRHIRNAVAHGRIIFKSESRNPGDVTEIMFRDGLPPTEGTAFKETWEATISANDLLVFCRKLADILGVSV